MWISVLNISLIVFIWGNRPENRAARFSLTALCHLLESHPSIPICEPHIIGQTCVRLLHMGIYIHQRGLMDEFQMCFPWVWRDVSISRLMGEKIAPGDRESKVPVLLFPCDYLTSNCYFHSPLSHFPPNRANALTLYIINTVSASLKTHMWMAGPSSHRPLLSDQTGRRK